MLNMSESRSEIIEEMQLIDDEIDEIERREEVYWAQRSHQDWLRDRDRNTTFFHRKAEQRYNRNTNQGSL